MKTKKAKIDTEIAVVLELTREEALALIALIGPTTGDLGYAIYEPLRAALGDMPPGRVWIEANARFPDLKVFGSLQYV